MRLLNAGLRFNEGLWQFFLTDKSYNLFFCSKSKPCRIIYKAQLIKGAVKLFIGRQVGKIDIRHRKLPAVT